MGLAKPPIPAVVALLLVTTDFGGSRVGGEESRSQLARSAGRTAAKGRGGAPGRPDAREAGRSVARGGARERGKRHRLRRRVPGADAAPPSPAQPRRVLSGLYPSVPLERSSHPPRAEALAGVPSAAMAQHFSLAACDVVGFDLDHTLCRYNLAESAPVSGAGCPGRTACNLHGGWGLSFLPSKAAASAAGACSRRAFAQNPASPHEAGRMCASPGPGPCVGTGCLSPSTSQV